MAKEQPVRPRAGSVVFIFSRVLGFNAFCYQNPENGMISKDSFARVLPTALLLSACYTQRPLERIVPVPATRIIAKVTDSGTVVMGGRIGPGAEEVEGVVATADENVWELRLLRVDQRGGASVLWNSELVSFPRYALTSPNEKRLDKTKSWMAAGLIAVGAFVAARLFQASGADEDTSKPPPPPLILIPGGGKE